MPRAYAPPPHLEAVFDHAQPGEVLESGRVLPSFGGRGSGFGVERNHPFLLPFWSSANLPATNIGSFVKKSAKSPFWKCSF